MKKWLRLSQILGMFVFGMLVGPLVVAHSASIGNEAQEEYRAPWPERYRFERDGGCPVGGGTDPECTGHRGNNFWAIDINDRERTGNADCGDPLVATRNGSATLIPAWQSGNYGNLLGITHLAFNGGVTSSWYAHLASPTSAPWDSVFSQGDFIGTLGTTAATGCHLHFQLDLGSGSPLQGAQTTNMVLSGTPGVDGYDLQAFSDESPATGGDFASNNTGPGYGRPNAPSTMDPGPADAPLRPAIRTYARALAAYGVQYGSTKASSLGACGANRRWVKSCATRYGTIWAQGFVSAGFVGQIPKAIVEDPSGNAAYSVEGQVWKAYGRICSQQTTPRFVYDWIGAPVSSEYPFNATVNIQNFIGGSILKDFPDPNRITMTVYIDGVGTCVFSNITDVNRDPCYDVWTTGSINSIDLQQASRHFGNAGSAIYDDRYDVNRSGSVSSIDLSQISAHFADPCAAG